MDDLNSFSVINQITEEEKLYCSNVHPIEAVAQAQAEDEGRMLGFAGCWTVSDPDKRQQRIREEFRVREHETHYECGQWYVPKREYAKKSA